MIFDAQVLECGGWQVAAVASGTVAGLLAEPPVSPPRSDRRSAIVLVPWVKHGWPG